jgi:hypothetical protein
MNAQLLNVRMKEFIANILKNNSNIIKKFYKIDLF